MKHRVRLTDIKPSDEWPPPPGSTVSIIWVRTDGDTQRQGKVSATVKAVEPLQEEPYR